MIIHSKKLLGGADHGSFEYTTPGTYELTFKKRTKASIWMVGGGGCSNALVFNFNGSNINICSGGGSGAGFIGGIYIPAGTLTIYVGNLKMAGVSSDTKIISSAISGALITAGGGLTYNVEGAEQGEKGILTISSNAEIIPGTVLLETDGNDGELWNSACSGGASVYNGYGRGADYVNGQGYNIGTTNATTGSFKIVY